MCMEIYVINKVKLFQPVLANLVTLEGDLFRTKILVKHSNDIQYLRFKQNRKKYGTIFEVSY